MQLLLMDWQILKYRPASPTLAPQAEKELSINILTQQSHPAVGKIKGIWRWPSFGIINYRLERKRIDKEIKKHSFVT